MSLLTHILLLLVMSRALGELLSRMGQPALIGEIFAGILLGPSLLNLVPPSQALNGISELSVFLVVFAAGLEMDFWDVIRAFRGRGLVIAIIGFLLPFLSGLALGHLLQMDPRRAVFLGLCISITALPVAIRILENFNLLGTDIARFSIATAIINDIAALLFLGVILDMPVAVENVAANYLALSLSVLKTAAKITVFGGIVWGINFLFRMGGQKTGYIERFIEKTLQFFGKEALFGMAILFVLLIASASETLGAHFIIGTFFGGLLLSPDVFGAKYFEDIKHTLHSITAGFLAPIFFAFLGLHFQISALQSPLIVGSVIVVSIVSKIFSGWLGGTLFKMKPAEALGIGIILNGRGIMELVVANIALQRHFIGEDLFSTLVLMGIVTTVITPILFGKLVNPHLERS